MQESSCSRQELSGDTHYAVAAHRPPWPREAMVVMVIVDRWRQIILIPTQHSYILDIWPPETNVTDLAKKSCCTCGAYAPPITVGS